MKNQQKSIKMLHPSEVLAQVNQMKNLQPDAKIAEDATDFYAKEIFNFHFDRINSFNIDLSEFEGVI